MRKLDCFWMSNEDWCYWKENGVCVLKEDAPPEAQESYRRYLEQSRVAEEEMKKYGYYD